MAKTDPYVINPSGVKVQIPAEWLKDEKKVQELRAEGFDLTEALQQLKIKKPTVKAVEAANAGSDAKNNPGKK